MPMSVPRRGGPVHLEPPGPEPVDLGRFGEFGGRFAPETLVPALGQLQSGSATLKDAVNEAMRAWVESVESTHYCIGSAMGPHPFPWMVREFQRVVGDEARAQTRALLGGDDPDFVLACVGGGSNAIGTFTAFIDTRSRLVGVEAGGLGLQSGHHGAAVSRGV